MKSRNFRTAMAVTILYLGAITVLRGSDIGQFLWSGDLNDLGEFLAGVFAPAAFFWLIYGYLLQGKELQQTRETLDEQVTVLKDQAEAYRQPFTPCLRLGADDVTSEGDIMAYRFTLRNIGGPARDLKIIIEKGWRRYGENPPLSGLSPRVRGNH